MVASLQDAKTHLMATNEQFARLATEHHQYKDKLHELADKPYLTDQEQLEEVRLKKLKLHLKDQMESILHDFVKQA